MATLLSDFFTWLVLGVYCIMALSLICIIEIHAEKVKQWTL